MAWIAFLEEPAESVQEAGTVALLPSERPDLRVVQLPEGQPVLFEEAGSNPANENSAICLFLQVKLPLHFLHHPCTS